mmetsp:Transcript_31423/g.5686  ORF Transcript_31423/g.5686 Transcript_31423/m.5686 type:complete len:101 (+) Transcript_31423:178-480(+)
MLTDLESELNMRERGEIEKLQAVRILALIVGKKGIGPMSVSRKTGEESATNVGIEDTREKIVNLSHLRGGLKVDPLDNPNLSKGPPLQKNLTVHPLAKPI